VPEPYESALAVASSSAHDVVVARVPLEQRSTTRLALGFVGMVIVPVAAVAAVICYCVLQLTNSLVDFMIHLF
jgi:hypothetical protein